MEITVRLDEVSVSVADCETFVNKIVEAKLRDLVRLTSQTIVVRIEHPRICGTGNRHDSPALVSRRFFLSVPARIELVTVC